MQQLIVSRQETPTFLWVEGDIQLTGDRSPIIDHNALGDATRGSTRRGQSILNDPIHRGASSLSSAERRKVLMELRTPAATLINISL